VTASDPCYNDRAVKTSYDPEVEGQYHAFVSPNPVRHRWHLNKLRLFELVGVSGGDRVLDAGCGAGNLVVELAPVCRTAVGCDYHAGRLSFATRRGAGRYAAATIEQLPFRAETFDKVFCLEVVEHVERSLITAILCEFHRVLKPRGRLVITTPNYRSLWPVIEVVIETLRLVPRVPGGAHVAKYDWRTLEGALTAAGFEIDRIGTFNLLSPFVAVLSNRWAERLYRWERATSRAGGHLLYALCAKP
jgi:2-polyprenyl-3-methyl-5-hydroxy-6-metoxy-1,4-benzoquinol methylase